MHLSSVARDSEGLQRPQASSASKAAWKAHRGPGSQGFKEVDFGHMASSESHFRGGLDG